MAQPQGAPFSRQDHLNEASGSCAAPVGGCLSGSECAGGGVLQECIYLCGWRLVWKKEFKDKRVPEDGLNYL